MMAGAKRPDPANRTAWRPGQRSMDIDSASLRTDQMSGAEHPARWSIPLASWPQLIQPCRRSGA